VGCWASSTAIIAADRGCEVTPVTGCVGVARGAGSGAATAAGLEDAGDTPPDPVIPLMSMMLVPRKAFVGFGYHSARSVPKYNILIRL
jgi:hypothetical protein